MVFTFLSLPFLSQLKQLSFTPRALILPLRPPCAQPAPSHTQPECDRSDGDPRGCIRPVTHLSEASAAYVKLQQFVLCTNTPNILHDGKERSGTKNNQADKTYSCFKRLQEEREAFFKTWSHLTGVKAPWGGYRAFKYMA